ncbi:zinc finger, CCHC-type containing protein [Tanacetum coccineum]
MKSHDSSFWKEVVNDEMDSIIGNNTWILVDLPHGSKAFKSKWIFKRKLRVDGSIEKFKARLVAKLIIHQMNVKTAFLNGKLEEEVYMEQPEDDMLIFRTDLEQVQMIKKMLSENFDMKDLGEADVILGIKILRKENRLMLTQSHYIEKILKQFNSFNCLPVSTPFEVGSKLTYNTTRILAQNKYAKVIGSLMYAMTCTRPDIAYVVGRLSRHTSSPGKEHWDAINQFLDQRQHCDNSSTVRFSNITNSTRAGYYIETKYLYVREKVEDNIIGMEYISTHDMFERRLKIIF